METKTNIANNLSDLRKNSGMTQSDLASKLNYSDKAISKWEHGEALPDIETLLKLCEMYGVTLNDIVLPDILKKVTKEEEIKTDNNRNKTVITCLAVIPVWIIAIIIFISLLVFRQEYCYPIFVYAIPLSAVILLVFNGIWGKHKFIFAIVSVLVWTLLVAVYTNLIYINPNLAGLWYIFFLGIPLQIATILWSQLESKNKKTKEK